MRITTRGRYALRASLALAITEKSTGKPVSISKMSEMEDLSPVFLEQIFFRLRKAGLVSSVRGPGGGFSFIESLDKVTVKQLLDAAGEDLALTFCEKHAENCTRIGECMSHNVWLDVTNMVNKYFEGITLASILEKYGDAAPRAF